MTTTATFSNGHADTYKGRRDVKAAWAIIDRETGKVYASGHSLDRAKAEKTANTSIQFAVPTDLPHFRLPQSRIYQTADYARYIAGLLREHGITGKGNTWSVARDANARRLADQRAKVRIEIVDL